MPYMLDDRHIEDSLFIVLEEDFRLFANSVEPIASEPKLTKGQTFLQQDLPIGVPAPRGSVAQELKTLQAHWQVRQDVPGDHKKVSRTTGRPSEETSFNYRPRKAQKGEVAEMSPHLEAIVRLVTIAKREDHGDIVWLNCCSNAARAQPRQ